MTSPITTVATEAELRNELTDLRSQLALKETSLRLVSEARDRLANQYRDERRARAADIVRIGEAFKSSAEQDGWEESYDAVVDSLNGYLTFELPTRRRDYRVRKTYTVTFSGVNAVDSDEAEELVDDDVRNIERLIDNYSGGYSAVSSVDSDSDVDEED